MRPATARVRTLCAATYAALLLTVTAGNDTAFADDPRDAELPDGFSVQREVELPQDLLGKLSTKFGATIERGTNAYWSIRGLPLQVNVITAADQAGAEVLFAALRTFRGPAFIGRTGVHVIEVAGNNRLAAGPALAALGALPNDPATYTVEAKLGCVDELDYMTANKVFNQFIALDGGGDKTVIEAEIRRLTKDWTMGRSVDLLARPHRWFEAQHALDPKPSARVVEGEIAHYDFSDLPRRVGVPYITLASTITVRPRFQPTPVEGDDGSTAATKHWPANDETIQALAKALTAKAETGRDRVRALALYAWATIKYAGEMGSRYGVLKVIKQKHGHCWDKSDVFITLCRAAGIPARQVAGWVPAMKSGHVWAEALIPGEGWLPVDATTPWLGISNEYVPLYFSEDGDMPIVYVGWPAITPKSPPK